MFCWKEKKLYICRINSKTNILSIHNTMITKTDINTEKKEINWLFPDEEQVVTIDDFYEMVQEAENQPGYSYQEHRTLVNEWLQNHQ